MPSTDRRSVLAAAGLAVAGGLAGCASLTGSADEPPAGSLRFVNEHDLPHSFSVRVTDVGSGPGEDAGTVAGDPVVPAPQRELTASTVVDPGTERTYEDAFTEAVWYAVGFTVDGTVPADGRGVVAWTPAPEEEGRGNVLGGEVYESGEFSWSVSRTENLGRFD